MLCAQSAVTKFPISVSNYKIPNKGTGIKVAILDTGIQYNHSEIKNSIKGGVNFTRFLDGSTNPKFWIDNNGYGTHIAGIVAAVDYDIGVIGVAPEALSTAVSEPRKIVLTYLIIMLSRF